MTKACNPLKRLFVSTGTVYFLAQGGRPTVLSSYKTRPSFNKGMVIYGMSLGLDTQIWKRKPLAELALMVNFWEVQEMHPLWTTILPATLWHFDRVQTNNSTCCVLAAVVMSQDRPGLRLVPGTGYNALH